jgi:DNA-binding NtrC family response regulator
VADVRALPHGGPTLVIMRSQEAMRQLAYDLTTVHKPVAISELVGRSQPAQQLRREVQRLAARDECVLIWAEPGSGASTVASALHDNGPRRDLPYVVVHVSATTEAALEAALFGRVELAGNEGGFAMAQGGSLLLDRVDLLPLRLQERLLAWLRERAPASACCPRLIATTANRLADAVRRGEFLGDLYGYLARATLRLLPLRQRKADLPDIAQAFLDRLERPAPGVLDPSALRLLLQYPWPGNLREMGAVVEVAARRAEGPILPEHLPERMQGAVHMPDRPLDEMVASFEASVIEPLLRAYGDDTAGKRKVAERLGISLATLYRKLQNS